MSFKLRGDILVSDGFLLVEIFLICKAWFWCLNSPGYSFYIFWDFIWQHYGCVMPDWVEVPALAERLLAKHHGQRLFLALTENPPKRWENIYQGRLFLKWRRFKTIQTGIRTQQHSCMAQSDGLPSSISCPRQWPKPNTWMLNMKIERGREKHTEKVHEWAKFLKTSHTVWDLWSIDCQREGLKSTCQHVILQAGVSTPCLLFKPVFAWPQHHGNAATQLTFTKFHLIATLACHLALIVIFSLISHWNTDTSHTTST